MTRILPLLFMLFAIATQAQKSYTELTEQAIKVINKEDTTRYQEAYNFIEKAFHDYPDSITGNELYYASILNTQLKNYNKAFEYLSPLAKMEKDEDGYPGWSFVLDEYAKEDYKNLMHDNRWETLKTEAQKDSLKFFKNLKEREQEFFRVSNVDLYSATKSKNLYKTLRTLNPYISKEHRDYSISLKINDSTATSYLVHLPKNYNPQNKYPVLFFLHGAVHYGELKKYQIPEINLGGWNRYYTKYGDLNKVILIFPSANKQYNWMTSDDGFFMIPKIVKTIKTAINIDDNKVFVSGHSMGATGSFSYLMKQPSLFAGFYGFNTYPKVFTGGTFIENISNRSFINFSTDQDYYYPPNANDQLDSLMNAMQLDYKDHRYLGYPHWFPQFDESEPAYQILFNDLKKRTRNPFPKHISWEFDDNTYGNIDWLSQITLDTLHIQKNWHKNVNFTIDKWLNYDEKDSLITKNVSKKAFDFPRKSGKITAVYNDNTFQIKTSRITSFKVNISPEMIDLEKEVKVYVNGKLYFNDIITYDKEFMIQDFEKNKDRTKVWVNQILVKT
ncbi:alpha/beta hydrolase-fold protein [Aquimarina sp. D1M17]|uniref:alpha/beta hydrolase-fold protein n=1 Tax=Aquimarina acroporae TaxID=2937283 RepID=UPI0020BDB362|nr:alpha/beta hydrolase-fold protein [Aquimarina acroporae]MCK8521460.1 alpha/beta hydrolase-fold protein [Aquimarina acroporae]